MAIKPIGAVIHYYNGIGVAIVKFQSNISVGQKIRIKGATTDFTQTIDSMQYDHKNINSAKAGEEVGIKVNDKVREGDLIFLEE
ncbi:MAG: translation elongation factor-like protein [Minisyncoccia bacterium]